MATKFVVPKIAIPPGTVMKRKFAMYIANREDIERLKKGIPVWAGLPISDIISDILGPARGKTVAIRKKEDLMRDGVVKGYKKFIDSDCVFRVDLRMTKFVYQCDTKSLAAALGVESDKLLRWLAPRKSDNDLLPLTSKDLSNAKRKLIKESIQKQEYNEQGIRERMRIFFEDHDYNRKFLSTGKIHNVKTASKRP